MVEKRFVISEVPFPGEIILANVKESRHLAARRVKKGEIIELIILDGSTWSAEVISVKPYSMKVLKKKDFRRPNPLTLAVAVPQANRASVMVEKCTEIGVGAFAPILCDRNTSRPKSPDVLKERWRRVAIAAVKQSGSVLPEIGETMPFGGAIIEYYPAVLLDASGGETFVSYLSGKYRGGPLTVFIGPEGGFTSDELHVARERDVSICRLGKSVLRVETAAIVACAYFAGRIFK